MCTNISPIITISCRIHVIAYWRMPLIHAVVSSRSVCARAACRDFIVQHIEVVCGCFVCSVSGGVWMLNVVETRMHCCACWYLFILNLLFSSTCYHNA